MPFSPAINGFGCLCHLFNKLKVVSTHYTNKAKAKQPNKLEFLFIQFYILFFILYRKHLFLLYYGYL